LKVLKFTVTPPLALVLRWSRQARRRIEEIIGNDAGFDIEASVAAIAASTTPRGARRLGVLPTDVVNAADRGLTSE
jgi:hypothetical protein